MKMRIHELAKALSVESTELLEKAEELGISVTTASSSVDGDDLVRLRNAFGGSHTVGTAEQSRKSVKGRTVIRRKARKLEVAEEEAPTAPPEAEAQAEIATEATAAEAAEPESAAPTSEVPAETAPQVPAVDDEAPSPADEPAAAEAEPSESEAPAAPVTEPDAEAMPAAAAAEAPAAADVQPAAGPAGAGAGPVRRAVVLGKVEGLAVQERNAQLAQQAARRGGPATGGAPRWPAGGGPGGGPAAPGDAPGSPSPGRRKVDFKKRRLERRSEIINRRDMLRYTPRKKKGPKKGGRATAITQPKASKMVVKMGESISVAELAKRLSIKASELMGQLMQMGQMVTVNETLDADSATLVANEFGYEVERVSLSVDDLIEQSPDSEENLEPRPPVVTVMGHVDHGKTSILDAIRKTDVVRGEAGGITQHIGAYQVSIGAKRVTFLDTPGHEAFTSMRARGANVTDLVVLVVAADDGVMPQTKEAINHAKAAEVPIVVAVNKMDVPDANPDRIMQQVATEGLQPEDWGGDTVFVKVSAKTGEGLDELLEAIQLQAEILELKANPNKPAKGVVVEAKLTRGRGPVATVLVREGTLKPGDMYITGSQSGKIRALMNDRGQLVKEAPPSVPVEVLGLDTVPQAGDTFYVLKDVSRLRQVVDELEHKQREASAGGPSKMSLEQMFERAEAGEIKELRIVLKADMQGSVEAVTESLLKQATPKVEVKVLHGAVGAISESDVMLASASNAVIVGFHVRPEAKARALAEREGIEIRCYSIIYELVDEVRNAMAGLLEPVYEEKILGRAEIRQLFNIPRVGRIAGCRVMEGEIKRAARARLLRDNVVVFQGKLASLRHVKDDVREISQGNECGLSFDGYNDIKEGDVVESYELEELRPSLD